MESNSAATTTTIVTTTTTTTTAATLGGMGSLPPLNPNDLALPQPPKRVNIDTSKPISVGEVYGELKQKVRDSIMESSVSRILVVMRVTNVSVAVFMLMIAFYVMFTLRDFWSGISEVFSVFYTIMFAVLLIAYEARSEQFDIYLRESFGFMYSPAGRCIFLCFISIFPFSMGTYGVLVSCLGFINAYLNYFVITKHPSFTRGVPDYEPPIASKEGASTSTSSSSSATSVDDSKAGNWA